MKDFKEESLFKVLKFANVRYLPQKDDKKSVWISAIALVAKSDGSQSYVFIEKDKETMENRIKVDFGSNSQIMKIIEYYPVSYLKAAYLHTFKTNKIEERVTYFSRLYPDKDYSEFTLKDFEIENIKHAVKIQINKEKNLK